MAGAPKVDLAAELAAPPHRFQIYDPHAEVTHRFFGAREAVAGAGKLGSSRILAVDGDRRTEPYNRAGEQWSSRSGVTLEQRQALNEREAIGLIVRNAELRVTQPGSERQLAQLDGAAFRRLEDPALRQSAADVIGRNQIQSAPYRAELQRVHPTVHLDVTAVRDARLAQTQDRLLGVLDQAGPRNEQVKAQVTTIVRGSLVRALGEGREPRVTPAIEEAIRDRVATGNLSSVVAEMQSGRVSTPLREVDRERSVAIAERSLLRPEIGVTPSAAQIVRDLALIDGAKTNPFRNEDLRELYDLQREKVRTAQQVRTAARSGVEALQRG